MSESRCGCDENAPAIACQAEGLWHMPSHTIRADEIRRLKRQIDYWFERARLAETARDEAFQRATSFERLYEFARRPGVASLIDLENIAATFESCARHGPPCGCDAAAKGVRATLRGSNG